MQGLIFHEQNGDQKVAHHADSYYETQGSRISERLLEERDFAKMLSAAWL